MMNIPTPPLDYFLCTAGQSQQMDARTIDQFGIDGYTLMEVAGSSAAGHLRAKFSPGRHGLYLCGKGNNAGDALVVARYLVQHGIGATIVLISGDEELSTDTDKNLELLQKIAENDPNAAETVIIPAWDQFDPNRSADFIIDGMLGTGLDSELRGDYQKAVSWVNDSALPVISIDIPTGLHADTGEVMGEAVIAQETYSFGTLKQGFYLGEGPLCTGKVIFCELPFPNYLKECDTYLIDEQWVPEPVNPPARHKYEAGVLYIVAGSEGLTGAAIMTAESAWAEGIGAVMIICPKGILPVFESSLPQIIKKPVGSRDDYFFKEEHAEQVRSVIHEKPGKILLGPGLGRDPSTVAFVHDLLDGETGDLLIDADGLWALAQQDKWNKPDDANWLLTPHPGELANLLDAKIPSDADRLALVRDLCVEKKITVVSKGYPVIVGTASGNCYLTGYDTRMFARAGFGDILAGKIGAFWIMTGESVTGSFIGLLDGKRKAENLKKQYPNVTPEPLDLV